MTIPLPSLAERRDDIPLLVHSFLRRANEKNSRSTYLTPAAVQALLELPWPGNVRELENFIQRLVILALADEIGVEEVRQAHQNNGYRLQQADVPVVSLKDAERDQIVKVLKDTDGNRSLAARRLGIERKTLYVKAKRLGIDLKL